MLDFTESAPAAFRSVGYQLGRQLGRGGFGIVYAAQRLEDGQEVAVKAALPGAVGAEEQLARERAALETIGPPSVPQLFEHGSVLGQPFLALEYIKAPTLADILVDHNGPLPLERGIELSCAILDALHGIHEAEFVHRDLKPENIFILNDRAKIIDFGLARPERVQPSMVEVTGIAEDIGTNEYMSPEQCDGLSDADRRSDIYGMGVILYEVLTGAPPFFGSATDVREAHRSRRPALVSRRVKCPPALDQAVRRCLAKDRAQRFQSTAELKEALIAALPTIRASLPPPPQRLPSKVPAAPRAAAAAPGAAREKRTMGLLFFRSGCDMGAVQPVVRSCGGQIAQTDGEAYVAAFGHDLGDNPARIALAAAQRLHASKIAERLSVDVAAVTVQQRPDGSTRVFSPLFTKGDRFPAESDPEGIQLTRVALDVLPDLTVRPLEGRDDRALLELERDQSDSTWHHTPGLSLLGRDELLQQLSSSAQRALLRAEPTIVTIVGEAGYGRSHLAGVAAPQIERTFAAQVLRLTAQGNAVGSASRLLPDLLRSALTLPAEAPADGGRKLFVNALGQAIGEQVWAAAAAALGWIDGQHPELRRLAAAPGALRVALARAAGEALRRRAAKQRLALVLDDAHLADDTALDALEYASLKEGGAKLWICVLVRPGFSVGRPTWGSSAAHSQTIQLPALAPAAAAELARRLLSPIEYVSQQVLLRLAERTQGIPRLLVELVRGLKRDGIVRRSERGTGYFLATEELDKLPELPIVEWNAKREVDALPPQLSGQVRLASILGNDFTVAEMDGLLAVLERDGLPDDMQLDASVGVQRLVAAGLLVQHRTGRIEFRHSLLRDTVYQLVPEAQRKKLHHAAYEMYQSVSIPPAQRSARIAFHAARGGKPDVAARCYLELAERHALEQAYLDAEAAYGKALEYLPETDHERIALAAHGRGLMRFRLGRQEDAIKDFRLAREHAHARTDVEREADVLLDEATVLDWTGDYEQSASLVAAAAALPLQASELMAARLKLGFARSKVRKGDFEGCVRDGSEAAEMAGRLGEGGYETHIISLLLLGGIYAGLGRLEEAERALDTVISEAETRSDVLHLSAAYNNRMFVWVVRLDLQRALHDLERGAQICREAGLPAAEINKLGNLAEVAYMMNDMDAAARHNTRGMELTRQMFGDFSREMSARDLLRSRIALYEGRLDEARAIVNGLRDRVAEAKAKGTADVELLMTDQVLLEMVELGTRNAPESEWDAFLARHRAIQLAPYEDMDVLENRALCAVRNGQLEVAERHLKRGLEISAMTPNLLSARLQRTYDRLFGAQALH